MLLLCGLPSSLAYLLYEDGFIDEDLTLLPCHWPIYQLHQLDGIVMNRLLLLLQRSYSWYT
uniref:Uncharacterized protein n=1 Tax=Rhizophora mucronata TaxID=61149 RepID=A0A2P2PIC2_RHIMU